MQYDNHGKTLRIREVGFDDEGSYDCDATNDVGTPVSHSVQLKVLGKMAEGMSRMLLLVYSPLFHSCVAFQIFSCPVLHCPATNPECGRGGTHGVPVRS